MSLLFTFAAGAAQAQPSFDCSGRLTPTEEVICKSPDLAALDLRMARQFRLAQRRAGRDDLKRLQYEQIRTWLPYRDACRVDRNCLRLRYLGRIAELQGRVVEPGPAAEKKAVEVRDDGVIATRNSDGSWSLYNPVTGDIGTRRQDGEELWFKKSQVQHDDLPVLPASALGDWPAVVQQSLDSLAGNLLTPGEVETLKAHAPPDFMARLRYNLGAFIHVTQAAP